MRRRIVLVFGMYVAAGVQSSETNAAAPIRVAATVSPIVDLVEQVGGELVQVTGLIPEGADSHVFEPPPSAAHALQAADLIIANGLYLEASILKLAERVRRPGSPVIQLGNDAIGQNDWRFDTSFPESAGSPNPHLWPNVDLTMRYVEQIRVALTTIAPEYRAAFGINAAKFREELSRLDAAVFTCIASIPPEHRKLITYHDSFAYFAPRYGVEVIAAVQPAAFTEPSPRDVAMIVDQIRALEIPVIFGSEVFPSQVLEQISAETGALYVDSLRDDDLPGEPGDPDHSYIGMMTYNVRTMTEALGGDPDCIPNFDY